MYLTSKSYAFFAQGTGRLFDETRLTAGARWTHEHRTMTGSVLESDLIDGVTTAPYVCEGGFCGAVTPSAYTQSKPTWRISLDQKFSTDIMGRSEEHTSELQSLMRISYAVFCLKQ